MPSTVAKQESVLLGVQKLTAQEVVVLDRARAILNYEPFLLQCQCLQAEMAPYIALVISPTG